MRMTWQSVSSSSEASLKRSVWTSCRDRTEKLEFTCVTTAVATRSVALHIQCFAPNSDHDFAGIHSFILYLACTSLTDTCTVHLYDASWLVKIWHVSCTTMCNWQKWHLTKSGKIKNSESCLTAQKLEVGQTLTLTRCREHDTNQVSKQHLRVYFRNESLLVYAFMNSFAEIFVFRQAHTNCVARLVCEESWRERGAGRVPLLHFERRIPAVGLRRPQQSKMTFHFDLPMRSTLAT